MTRAVVVVWVGAISLRTAHEPDLASWAEARGIELDDLAPDAPLPALTHDDDVATRVDGAISEALSIGEPREAASLLGSAEALLRAHADLAESAWLMAEILRARATLGAFGDEENAGSLERLADTLEGPRAEPFDPRVRPKRDEGKAPEETSAAPDRAAEAPGGSIRFGPGQLLPTDDVFVDGVVAPHAELPRGLHHVRVVRGSGLAWAGWTDSAERTTIRIPGSAPCSPADLGAVDTSGSRVVLEHRVLCPNWVVARSAGTDRIEVAQCRESDCGTFLPWRRQWGASFEPPVHSPWPAAQSNSWIFWTAASVAAAAATGVALWQAGVFEREPEKQVRFVVHPPP